MRRFVHSPAFRLLLVGLAFSALAKPRGPGGQASPPPVLEIKWILDTSSLGAGGAYIELKAKYQVRSGWGGDYLLKYLGGGLVRGEGHFDGDRAVFEDASPADPTGAPLAGLPNLPSRLDYAGVIRMSDGGKAEIELYVVPGFRGISGPYDEALGCYQGTENKIAISQDDLRKMHDSPLRLQWSVVGVPAMGCSGTFSVEIGANLDEVKADPGGAYTTERGAPFELDGSHSKGKGLNYKWTITPKGCPTDAGSTSGGHKQGAQPTVVLLCDADITLTVSDGKTTDTKSTSAVVRARTWKTKFAISPVEKQLPPGGDRLPLVSIGRDRGIMGGENRCAIEEYSTKSDHVLHPERNDEDSWETSGYELEQVQDPGGPFDQWWFVSDYKLKINRQAYINPYIIPGGTPPLPGAEPFYQANQRLGTDVAGYLAAVRAHEGVDNGKGVLGHSGLLQQALPQHDPGPKLEGKFRSSKEELKGLVDSEIRKAEIALCNATKDPLPEIWRGKLAFAEDDTGIYRVVQSPLSVGGAFYQDSAPCK